MSWVALNIHSQYSILEATSSIAQLVSKAQAYQMQALALTDQSNLYGAVEFFKTCKKSEIKPILGCEFYVAPQSRNEKKKKVGFPHGFSLILLAKNKKGYENLCQLSSLAHLEGFYYTPRIDREILELYSEGLICLSGNVKSSLAHWILQEKKEELIQEIQWYQKLFKEDYFFEIVRHAMNEEAMQLDGMHREPWLFQAALEEFKKEKQVELELRQLAKQFGIACVATNISLYLNREDWKAHEILMNIQSGEPCEIWERDSFGNPKSKVMNPKRKVLLSHEYYFKSPHEMTTLFEDFPEAIGNSIEISNKCNFSFDFKTKYYPVFIPPNLVGKKYSAKERTKEAENFLRQLCNEKISVRYTSEALSKVKEKYPDKNPLQIVQERLTYELEIITSKGMCDYLLIVYDFISWAKNRGIPVGPGRGSGAGSIICYLTGITDIEPLRFNLLFERFINPERISYPDIDVDICMERRSEVIEYTISKYGKDKVAQIITFGTMKAKMAIKDVGRVLNIPLSKVNAIAKLVPEDPNMTLDKALEMDHDLKAQYESDEETKRLIDLAKSLEGSIRNTGIHAAGLIISADPIVQHIPICTAKDTEFMVTQFSMKPVEEVGMLKIDFLGLKTLTAIQMTVESIQERVHKLIDWVNLPLDDKQTFELLNQGKTLGLFQLESGGMQELVKQLHIDKFEEIIAVGALYRPGPMEMIPSFINRKHGRENIEIDHPLMHHILAETYGIMVYQEQVIQIASLLAGYSLGEGDVLRRAMGKKDKQEMAKQRDKFQEGARQKGIDEQTAMQVFDKIEKFASYGFNKSHAAAYGYLSYVTAYLKAHYPTHWMAALMTTDRDDLSKVTKIIRESHSMGIAILPPDINESDKTFVPINQGIRFALNAIKGVGEGVVDHILEERKSKGIFESLSDFLKRVDTNKVGKKVIEHLVEAGCFDFTKWPRPALIQSIESLFHAAQQEQKESSRGILNLFSLMESEQTQKSEPPTDFPQISKIELLKREKQLLGLYLTGHPLEEYHPSFGRLSCVPLSQFAQLENGVYRTAFIIENIVVKLTAKTGKKFAILTISDGNVSFELPVWSELYVEKQNILIENQLIYAILQIENQQKEIKFHCRWLEDLTKLDEGIIQTCDLAFEKAKQQMKSFVFRNAQKSDGKKLAAAKKIEKTIHLKIDALKMRMSHILGLKALFQAHPGDSEVVLEFIAEQSKLGQLKIHSSWGIEMTPEVKKKLESFIAVQECKETVHEK